MTLKDTVFLERAISTVNKHLSDKNFNVQDFANEMGMSRSQVHRRLRGLRNQNCGEFILSVRMDNASELIREKRSTIREVSEQVGFKNQSYFTKCFKKRYGILPTEYERRH